MINYIIPLLESYFDSILLSWYYYPLFALAFIACVPVLIRQFFFWR